MWKVMSRSKWGLCEWLINQGQGLVFADHKAPGGTVHAPAGAWGAIFGRPFHRMILEKRFMAEFESVPGQFKMSGRSFVFLKYTAKRHSVSRDPADRLPVISDRSAEDP